MIRFQAVLAGNASKPSIFRLTPAERRASSSAVSHKLHHNTQTTRMMGRVGYQRQTNRDKFRQVLAGFPHSQVSVVDNQQTAKGSNVFGKLGWLQKLSEMEGNVRIQQPLSVHSVINPTPPIGRVSYRLKQLEPPRTAFNFTWYFLSLGIKAAHPSEDKALAKHITYFDCFKSF